MQEKYAWLPAIGAPEEYPVKIIKGQFIAAANGYSPELPQTSFVNSGWGDSGSLMAIGPDLKPVPESLVVTWLSYAENKFYSGKFALPVQKIKDLFEAGYLNHETNRKEPFTYLTLGFLPGGGVVLWIAGGREQIEIQQFKAEPVVLQAGDFSQDYAYIFEPGFAKNAYQRNIDPAVTARLAKEGIDYSLMEKLQKRYTWKYKVNSAEVKFYDLQVSYFNAEATEIFAELLLNNPLSAKGIPKEAEIAWIDKKNQRMVTRIVFDEQEIREAFSQVQQQGELEFKVDPDAYRAEVILHADGQTIRLERQHTETVLKSN